MEPEFDAQIIEQHPDERVAWRSTSGPTHAGVVTFHRLDEGNTRVMLQLEVEPEGIVQKAGDWLGILNHRTKGDLKNFSEYTATKGDSEGWRGDVTSGS